MTYIPFPDISPEIFAIDIGPVTLALRWYALAYIVGLIAGWKLIVRSRVITTPPPRAAMASMARCNACAWLVSPTWAYSSA